LFIVGDFFCAGAFEIFHLHAFGVLCLLPRRGRRAKARLILFIVGDFFAPERLRFFIYTP
jgi:hypothetical protein